MSSNEALKLYQEAERLKAQGSLQDAATSYRQALDLDPHSVELRWALGDLCAQMEDFTGVENCCREIISRNPGIPEAHLYLGMALQRQDRLEEAEAALIDTLHLRPDYPDAYFQLGIVQQSLGKSGAAVDSYQNALQSISDRAPVLYNLSGQLERLGRIGEAFDRAFEALQAAPESRKYRQNFVRLLNVVPSHDFNDATFAEVLRCFDMPGVDLQPLMKPCLLYMAQDEDFEQVLCLAADSARGLAKAGALTGCMQRLSRHELLYRLLLHTKIASPQVETLLNVMRATALGTVMQRPSAAQGTVFGDNTKFAEALACQFFNAEYAAFVTPEEFAEVKTLAEGLSKEIADGGTLDSGFVARLTVYCMYQPLFALNGIERMFAGGENRLHVDIPVIVKRQWLDRQVESALRSDIETLTPIRAEVSTSVREQYEESPYPRWLSVDLHEPVSCRESMLGLFPHFDAPDFGAAPVDVLVAGCGTGRHAIMAATHFAHSEVVAVDLSKTSLAYAQRKAREAGLTNIRFAQADILELGALDRTFKIIESVGVLHHMQEPREGLKVLSGLLVEGGLLRLGLYSAYGRRAVAAARQYIAERRFEATADGIRAARRALLALDAEHPAYPATRFRDFYTLSECRDLLFHVQEHCLRIPELSVLLKDCGLRFIGFTPGNSQALRTRYRERYPDDINMTDLSRWDEIERSYPDTFEEMYQFWCQKA